MAVDPRLRKMRQCYLCNLFKCLRAIVFMYSEPVCRGCLNHKGSNRIEKEIQKARWLKNPKRVSLELKNSVSSTSRNTLLQMQLKRSKKGTLELINPFATSRGSELRQIQIKCRNRRTLELRNPAASTSGSELKQMQIKRANRGSLELRDPVSFTSRRELLQMQFKHTDRGTLELRNPVTSTSRSELQEKKPINRSSSIPLLRKRYSRAMNSPVTGKMFNKVPVSESVKPYYAVKSAAKPASTIATVKDSAVPQVLNSTISRSKQQQPSNQNVYHFFFCRKCKQPESRNKSVQCSVVRTHIFCIECAKVCVIENIISGSGTHHCPSGNNCTLPGARKPWRIKPADFRRMFAD